MKIMIEESVSVNTKMKIGEYWKSRVNHGKKYIQK